VTSTVISQHETVLVETGNQLRLAIVPRPRGGDWLEDELDQMKRAGGMCWFPCFRSTKLLS
jgi:hypothetical protein